MDSDSKIVAKYEDDFTTVLAVCLITFIAFTISSNYLITLLIFISIITLAYGSRTRMAIFDNEGIQFIGWFGKQGLKVNYTCVTEVKIVEFFLSKYTKGVIKITAVIDDKQTKIKIPINRLNLKYTLPDFLTAKGISVTIE